MAHKCPKCMKQFEEIHVVHSNSSEPFTCVEVFEGLDAFASIYADKELICHTVTDADNGGFTHFRFMLDGEERLVQVEPFDLERIARLKAQYAEHPQPCEHEGCTAEASPCYIRRFDTEPNGWYCAEHAKDGGFCWSCGFFYAGWESFDFNPNGLCEGCQEAIDDEMNDGYDPDLDFGYEFDPYESDL